MVIDSSHRRWLLVTCCLAGAALFAYAWFDTRTPGGITGGSVAGLWYGLLGSLLMVFAGLLSALRRVPTWWWIGSRQTWLRGHIWLGLLSGLFIGCHSGWSWGGPLEVALWAVLLAVLGSGVVGLALQHVVPRLLTARTLAEAPYEQIPHRCQTLRRQADTLIDDLCGPPAAGSKADDGDRAQLRRFFESQVRPFLADGGRSGAGLLAPVHRQAAFARFRQLPEFAAGKEQERVKELEALCEERSHLAQQERLHAWLHGWLLVHVPLSAALLVLGLVHAYTALYY